MCPGRGPGQRIPSFRSHISRIPLSYFTAWPLTLSPPLPLLRSFPTTFASFDLSLIFCSLAFRDPPASLHLFDSPPRLFPALVQRSIRFDRPGRTAMGAFCRLTLRRGRISSAYPHCRGCFVRYVLCLHVGWPRCRGIHYANIYSSAERIFLRCNREGRLLLKTHESWTMLAGGANTRYSYESF